MNDRERGEVRERFRVITRWSLADEPGYEQWCARHPGAHSIEIAAEARRRGHA